MRLEYYSDTDTLFFDLADRPVVRTEMLSDSLVIDFDEAGVPVGITIEQASKSIDMQSLEAQSLPLLGLKAA